MNKFLIKAFEKQKLEADVWFADKSANVPLPDNVIIDRDIPYIDDGMNCHKMDIYYTSLTNEPRPVIFNFHGGGMISCERNVNQWLCAELAKCGYVVICIDYPLVPKADIYTILKDSYTGITTAMSLLDNYNCDKNRLFICGDSAGGFICTYLVAMQNNPEIAKALNIQLNDIHFKAFATIGGMFYSSKVDRHGLFILRKAFFGKNYKKHPFWKYVNPEQSSIIDFLPPSIHVTAKKDFLRDYTIRFLNVLKNANKQFVLKDYQENDALTHDFVCLMPETKEAKDACKEIAAFFDSIN